MSATFSQPTGPTTGLAPYGLVGSDLAIRNAARGSVRPGLVRSPRRRRRRVRDEQQETTMAKAFLEAVDALRTSVSEIVTANPENRDELLKKSFDAFSEHLAKKLDEELPLGPGEADPVAVLADSLAGVERAIGMIESGACIDLPAGAVSDEALTLAKAWCDMGEIVVRTAALDFAAPVEPGERVEGEMSLVKVASNAAGGEILVKTVLPEPMAQLLADPADTADALALLGFDLLGLAGVQPREIVETGFNALGKSARVKLAKRLAKKAPFPPKAKAEEEDESEEDAEYEDDEESEDDEQELEAGEGDEGEYEEGEEGEDNFDPEAEGGDEPSGNPLDNLSRLGSMMLVEIENVRASLPPEALQGGGAEGELSMLDAMGQHAALLTATADALLEAAEGGDEAGYAEPDVGEGPPVEGGEPEPVGAEEFEKGAKAKDLQKAASDPAAMAEIEAIKRQLAEVTSNMAALSKAAAPAKAILAPALSRAAETGGQAAEITADELAKQYAVDPEKAALALTKMALGKPITALPPIR
jgi:hypothetical protein